MFVDHRSLASLCADSYATLFAPGLATTSKLGLFLNLIYRSMKADDNVARVQAFAKRLLQISHHMPSNFAAGALFLLGEVMRQRPEVASIVSKPETLGFDDSDGEEDFQDAKLPAGGVEVVPATEAGSGSDDDSDEDSDASSSGDSDAAGEQEGSDALKAERSGALALLDSLVDNDGDAATAEGTAGGSGEQKTTELEGAAGAAARGEGVVRGTRYDPMKRDPAFALADQAPLWELVRCVCVCVLVVVVVVVVVVAPTMAAHGRSRMHRLHSLDTLIRPWPSSRRSCWKSPPSRWATLVTPCVTSRCVDSRVRLIDVSPLTRRRPVLFCCSWVHSWTGLCTRTPSRTCVAVVHA